MSAHTGRPAHIFGALDLCTKEVIYTITYEAGVKITGGTRRETQDVRARTATTRMGSSGAPIQPAWRTRIGGGSPPEHLCRANHRESLISGFLATI